MIKEKTCCFSGHRALRSDFNVEELKKAVYKTVNDNFDTFLCGMALGFDTLVFSVLEEVRQNNNIKIVACVPCRDQAEYFNKKQKAEYQRMIDSADEVIVLCEEYEEGCMQNRNAFMVDNSSRLITYLVHSGGGTYYTVKYATEKGVEIIYLGK